MFKLANNENRHIVQSIAIYNLGGIFTKAESVEVNIWHLRLNISPYCINNISHAWWFALYTALILQQSCCGLVTSSQVVQNLKYTGHLIATITSMSKC